MTLREMYSVIYTCGVEQAGTIAGWEKFLDEWAKDLKQKELQAEMRRRRHDPTFRPTKEHAPGQVALMKMGGPAPRREEKT